MFDVLTNVELWQLFLRVNKAMKREDLSAGVWVDCLNIKTDIIVEMRARKRRAVLTAGAVDV